MSTKNWQLPATEEQQHGHLPSAGAAAAADLEYSLKGIQALESVALSALGKLMEQVFKYLDIFRN